jgi:hypothetical protein
MLPVIQRLSCMLKSASGMNNELVPTKLHTNLKPPKHACCKQNHPHLFLINAQSAVFDELSSRLTKWIDSKKNVLFKNDSQLGCLFANMTFHKKRLPKHSATKRSSRTANTHVLLLLLLFDC